jgi:hypothetical protein
VDILGEWLRRLYLIIHRGVERQRFAHDFEDLARRLVRYDHIETGGKLHVVFNLWIHLERLEARPDILGGNPFPAAN